MKWDFLTKLKKALIGESKEQDKVQGEVEELVESPESSVDESSVADDHSAQEQTVESTEPTLDSRPETTTDSALQPTETEESAADTSSSEGAQDLKSAEPFDVVTPSETVKKPEVQPQPTAVHKEDVQDKYTKGLSKSRKTFGQRLNELFANFRSVDERFF